MRRPPLLAAGKPRPAVPNPDSTHHEVALYLLKLFPYFPLAAGEPSGRKPAGAALPVPLPCFWPAKGHIARPQFFPGVYLQKFISFLVSKIVKFVNSYKIVEKSEKMQTKTYWIPCSKIYNFPYRLIFSL